MSFYVDNQARLVETRLEDACRDYMCPSCGAPKRRPCQYGRAGFKDGSVALGADHAHTGRYLLALADGLVPPLRGGHMVGLPAT